MSDFLIREIQLSLWKIHILHHATERPVYGRWVIEELRRHGFDVSPGTLYPLLTRMEAEGWLRPVRLATTPRPSKARRELRVTPKGVRVLARLRAMVEELHREVVRDQQSPR